MTNLATRNGDLYLIERFVGQDEASVLYGLLLNELSWSEEEIAIGGARVKVPRLVCWYGDAGVVYSYSGVTHASLPWTPTLKQIKDPIEDYTQHTFNSVLGNLYRDGNDSMGWHADKEKELGRDPFIASLSLGAERLFKLRHNRTGETISLNLTTGSLLLMGSSLQHYWRHCVPKSKRQTGERINLTFRKTQSL